MFYKNWNQLMGNKMNNFWNESTTAIACVIIFFGAIVFGVVETNHIWKQELAEQQYFMTQCLTEHKEYECIAMYRGTR